ncbi:MAG: Rpn family recombination-promoting nuclease/putative transposase [Treponema sp.]|nr:Rpn family recombination-promoting nuclease/putative transposase [Treponema sp.]
MKANTEITELTPEQKWERATLANNFIFYKVMRNNPDVCKELLETLLEMELDHIEMHGEETIETDYGSKVIRLDVYAKNNTQAFNLEMQAADTKELPERSRYYQGCIDVDTLQSGQKYKELKDSYVIFICITDIFEKGLPCYHFENLCCENHLIKLNDRAYKYFFVAKNCDKILNEKQKAFLELVIGRKPSNKFTERLAQLTEEAKKNTQWKRQYMDWERQRTYDYEDGKEAGITIGLAEGAQQKAVEAAIILINKYHASPEEASEQMNAPLELVLEYLKKKTCK